MTGDTERVIASLKALERQGEDYIWRPAKAAREEIERLLSLLRGQRADTIERCVAAVIRCDEQKTQRKRFLTTEEIVTALRALALSEEGLEVRPVAGKKWARELTDAEIAAELETLGKRWGEFQAAGVEHGGSPGEWMYERLGELDQEQKRRATLPAAKGSGLP